MKEQINRLARGEFQYEMPQMVISDKSIEFNIAVNDYYKGQFQLDATGEIKGIVYSTSNRVSLDNAGFCGINNVIDYTVDMSAMTVGDVIDGQFDIVSNAGEKSISYRFKAVDKTTTTSMGEVYNIFHFANLAQMEPIEAQKVFESPDFLNIFLSKDKMLQNTYETLIKGSDISCSIEEFLIAARKKSIITLKLSKDKCVYDNFTDNYSDSIYISKSTWGYSNLKVYSDADFIQLKVNQVKSEEFTGNKYELNYVLDKSRMHYGRNYGRIIVMSLQEELHCDIEVDNYSIGIIDSESRYGLDKEYKKVQYELTKEYMRFRTKQIDVREWAEKSNQIINAFKAVDDNNTGIKIAQAQIYFIQQRDEEGQWLLDNVRDDILQNKANNVIIYCYYLYVNSLAKKSAEYSKEILQIIKNYYDNGYDEWQILWMLFYINEDYDKNKSIKLTRIKEQFHKGCKSPIMYLEACNIINAQPVLVRVLNEFEMQVINFGCKYNLINDKTSAQICEIVDSGKIAPKTYLRILNSLYQKFDNDTVLGVLCTHMIRNEMTGVQYFKIYEKSILRGLRITRLYEFYIECANIHDMTPFPKMVLMYFNYNSQLTYDRRAYLYANIITNKQNDAQTYQNYRKQFEIFAFEQIRLEHIDDNLTIIYKDIWDKSIITADTAPFITKILFTYKVTVFNDVIKYAIVKHKETIEEIRVPIVSNTAYVQLYTDNAVVVFEDAYGHRRKDSIQYELEKMFEDMSFIDEVSEYNDSLYLTLYLCEKNIKYQKYTARGLRLQNALLGDELVEDVFKQYITGRIIDYYYSEYVGDEFRSFFPDIEKENLNETDATKLIEACIVQGMYEDAYDLTLVYGYEKVNPKRLFKMLRRMIEIFNYEYNDFIVDMCEYVFINKKYDDLILEYMVGGYNASNSDMLSVWHACVNFNVESYELEERIIAQMMFTGDYSKELVDIFEKYYERGAKDRIVEAFLAGNSYLYFVRNQQIDEKVLALLENRMQYDMDVIIVCKLALLKHYSQLETLSDKQLEMSQSIIYEMCNCGKIFSLYKKFEDKFSLPYNIVDKTIIEYSTNPANKVIINYLISSENHKEEYIEETMKDTFEGIFTKEFTLFYGESLQYYITEIANGETRTSDNYNILCNNINPDSTEGRFDYINDMLASKELHDMATLRKLMHGYSVQDYVVKQIFKPL